MTISSFSPTIIKGKYGLTYHMRLENKTCKFNIQQAWSNKNTWRIIKQEHRISSYLIPFLHVYSYVGVNPKLQT